MFDTTAGNLRLIEKLRKEEPDIARVTAIIDALAEAAAEMRGDAGSA